MTYLDTILRFFSSEEYSNRQNIPIIISNIFEQNPDITIEDFKRKISITKTDFFRINRLNRDKFAERIFQALNLQKIYEQNSHTQYQVAKDFIIKNLEIGFQHNTRVESRKALIRQFSTIKMPHEAIMNSVNRLLDKLEPSYSIDLHGVKEYSGIDIAKTLQGSVIGFQIKTRDDDISENMILSEITRARNYEISGFVLIYARTRTKKVEASIQGAYHIFKRLKDQKEIYPAIVEPDLLAELFLNYSISVTD
jgi:hypothetical protein